MIKNYFISFLLLLLLGVEFSASAQEAKLKVTVFDAKTKEAMIGASVVITGGVVKKGKSTDVSGVAKLPGVPAGNYTLQVSSIGYVKVVKEIVLYGDKNNEETISLKPEGYEIAVADVIAFKKKLFDKDQTSTINTATHEEIQKSPYTGVNQIIGQASGVFVSEGSTPIIKGQNSSGTIYFVDGVRVIGSTGVPTGAIDQLSVITGGIPAEYGDAIGGVINITTRGPQNHSFGGLQLLSSQLFDPYGFNQVEANYSGPLGKVKNKGTDSARSKLGYFLAGNYTHAVDGDPYATDIYRIKDSKLEELKANPLRPSPTGQGYISNAEYVTKKDMELVRIKQNVQGYSYTATGKVDWQPSDNINITAGGNYAHNDGKAYIYQFALLNYYNNPQSIGNTYRGYLRFKQSFNSDTGSIIQNASYSINADYTKVDGTTQDPIHKDNIFDYGYLGSFKQYNKPVYLNQVDTIDGNIVTTNYLAGYQDTLVTFDDSKGLNPVTANYTKTFLRLYENRFPSFNFIKPLGGLVNGDNPRIVYSLWNDVGTTYGSYGKSESEQFNLAASGSADIGKQKEGSVNHSLKFGVQYEQRSSSGYSISSQGLWGLMRQLANFHLTDLDKQHPIVRYDSSGQFTNYVDYPYLSVDTAQTQFDKSFRAYLKSKGEVDVYGRAITDQTRINIDQYDPSYFKVDYFSADDLLNKGNSYVNYYGYDYKGNKLSKKPGINDFLNSEKRSIGAYNPIYIAGYIQDKFEFKDLIFNLGLRVDRFDANQKVLKDPYSLYPTRQVSEVLNDKGEIEVGNNTFSRPGNMGDNYVVYVDDPTEPTKLIGFRNGDKWFDETGAEVQDPNVLALATKSGTIAPYLQAKSEEEVKLTDKSFKDYQPQITVMPRVAFSFPISEDAVFYANYDVLTQRPKSGNFATIDDYYFLQARSTGAIANPDLKPERRTNYEIGFNQKLSRISALGLQAFYGEIKDMVQIIPINQAYPIQYTTFGNIDFGTVKGFTFTYDLRRPKTSGVQLQANYTLQFAEGTGSNATSAAALISVGQPNLRTPLPLDYDVRHQIVTTIDYRFGMGRDYTGPIADTGGRFAGMKWLQNVGMNMVLNTRSGTPYSRQSNITQDVAIGIAQRRSLTGSVNGSRLPWQFKADASIDKNFLLGRPKKGEDGEWTLPKKPVYANLYVTIQNVFNAKNVVGVYRYTGLPNDDAFLSSAEGQQTLNSVTSAEAFRDQYSLKVNNPNNYTQPRIARLGLRLEF